MLPSPSNPSTKICFNPDCKDTNSDRWRKGWRLRSGDFADLCDRCSAAYDELRFCELFHNNAPGWRQCESCAKRIHCGCIASVHSFLPLDAGGVECMGCANKSLHMASNQMWQSPLLFPPSLPHKLKDMAVKNWSQIYGPGTASGHWRPVTSVWNSGPPELRPRVPFEVDRLKKADKFIASDRPTYISEEKKKSEDLPERLKLALTDRITNDARIYAAAEASLTSPVNGSSFSANSNSLTNTTILASDKKEGILPARFGVSLPSSSEVKEPHPTPEAGSTRITSVAKQYHSNADSLIDASGDAQNHARNGRIRAEARGRDQLLPRYWPRITDQELQQISGDSNCVITPLFEKILSASDAGRIGRLVLPKKCAEAYFPAISNPEGQPLKIQDSKGKEWVFQFRFWPNNNSRMYVLEGVTPCIQSMQLQAGDTVTFSRMDPEGKLIMGCRKDQGSKTGSNHHANAESTDRNNHLNEPVPSLPGQSPKVATESNNKMHTNHTNPTDASWKKSERAADNLKDLSSKPSSARRKNNIIGSKTKRLRIEDEVSMELKLTWEEAQSFLRPPPDRRPDIIVVDGHEFEEYEEAPILGKPIFFTTNFSGERNQWAQCEDCSKWRKLPADVVLPARWTCHSNVWDCERSSCSAPEEVRSKERENIFSTKSVNPRRRRLKNEAKKVKIAEGLDTLANVAILGVDRPGPSSNQATTKHPRHRPGCTCIVCIQPPSGKGKHKQTCTCTVCVAVRRRFRTFMMRRGLRHFEKDTDSGRERERFESDTVEAEEDEKGDSIGRNDGGNMTPELVDNEMEAIPARLDFSSSIFKGQIDLNIRPEREEESVSASDPSKAGIVVDDAQLIERVASVEGKNDGSPGPSMTELEKGAGEKTDESPALISVPLIDSVRDIVSPLVPVPPRDSVGDIVPLSQASLVEIGHAGE